MIINSIDICLESRVRLCENKDSDLEMKQNSLYSIVKSWLSLKDSANSIDEILEWIEKRNKSICVDIKKIQLQESAFWFYDEQQGIIRNKSNSFFQIAGLEKKIKNSRVIRQPIILQNEIGFLGIICKEINGIMHFLMQAKIEPGNINKIQISPTIQATKSNFTQKHGGSKPPYLKYFEQAFRYEVVVDQIQSEQSSRFYKKRNRNIIIRVEEDIPVLPSHKWMTLAQIKKLMRVDNLVNMDTRTVLSCIPYGKLKLETAEKESLFRTFSNQPLFQSIFEGDKINHLPAIYQYINNYKMFEDTCERFIPLHRLKGWKMEEDRIFCEESYPYQVIYCDITIEGREVTRWTQPLFEAIGIATFGLICCEKEGALYFLVRATPELGCFDGIELGPTVQQEGVCFPDYQETEIDRFFIERLSEGKGVIFDHLLSEEGGRFYHEQNRNVLIKVAREQLPKLPDGYFLLDYRTLNELVQVNNTLNIQLRNLLSLLEA